MRGAGVIQEAVSVTVTHTVRTLIGDAGVWVPLGGSLTALIDGLAGSAAVRDFAADAVQQLVAQMLPDNPAAESIGGIVGDLIKRLLANSGVVDPVASALGAVLPNFFGKAGVPGVLADAAAVLAVAVVAGDDLTNVLPGILSGLQHSTVIQNALGAVVTDVVRPLLDSATLWQGLGDAITSFIDDLAGNAAVQDYAVGLVSETVAGMLGGGYAAERIGLIVGNTVVGSMVANPGFTAPLAAAIGLVLPDFLRRQGVPDVLTEVASELVVAIVAGDVETVLPRVMTKLRSAPILDAVSATVTDVAGSLLGNTGMWDVVGATITALVTNLAADPTVRVFAAEKVWGMVAGMLPGNPAGEALGHIAAVTVARLLADPRFTDPLASVLGRLLPDFLGRQEVAGTLGTSLAQLAVAVVRGEELPSAMAAFVDTVRGSVAIQNGAGATVTGLVGSLLGDKPLWQAFGGAVENLITDLAGDPAVEGYAAEMVAGIVAGMLEGNPAAQQIGQIVGDAVAGLLADARFSGGLAPVLGKLLPEFFGQPDIPGLLAGAAGQVAVAVVAGRDLTAVLAAVVDSLRGAKAFQDAVGVTVTDVAGSLLGDNPLWQAFGGALATLISGLAANPAVEGFASETVAGIVAGMLEGNPAAQQIGQIVGDAVAGLLADARFSGGLAPVLGKLLPEFFGQPDIPGLLAGAAGQVAVAVVAGDDLTAVLSAVVDVLRGSGAFQDAVGVTVTDVAGSLLGDNPLWQAFGGALATLISGLAANPAVEGFASETVAGIVAGMLEGNPAAQQIGQIVGDAVAGLLADARFSGGLASVLGVILPEFFGQPDIPGLLAGAAGQVAVAVVAGDDLTAVLSAVVDVLRGNGAFQDAVGATVSDVAARLLGAGPLWQALFGALGPMVSELAANPDVQAFLSAAIGPPFGDAIGVLLTDSAFVGDVVVAVGSLFSAFVAYPGVIPMLAGTARQVVVAVLGGSDVTAALTAALAALQADPVFQAAVAAVVPTTVDELLGNAAVRQAVGEAGRVIVINYLKAAGIDIALLDGVAGQVVKGAIDSLLANRDVMDLLSEVLDDVADGMPMSDITTVVFRAVLDRPGLQMALGMAIGQGVGSLFGDNIVGWIVGSTTGLTVTVMLGVAVGLIRLYEALFGAPPAAAAASAAGTLAAGGYVAYALPAAAGRHSQQPDLYDLTALLPTGESGRALIEALTTGAGLALTDLQVAPPDENQSDYLDVALAITTNESDDAHNQPLLVKVSFRVNQLISAPAPARNTRVVGRVAQAIA